MVASKQSEEEKQTENRTDEARDVRSNTEEEGEEEEEAFVSMTCKGVSRIKYKIWMSIDVRAGNKRHYQQAKNVSFSHRALTFTKNKKQKTKTWKKPHPHKKEEKEKKKKKPTTKIPKRKKEVKKHIIYCSIWTPSYPKGEKKEVGGGGGGGGGEHAQKTHTIFSRMKKENVRLARQQNG